MPVSARFEVIADWETEFNGQLTLTNDGDETVHDWALEFDFDPEITIIWDARIAGRDGSRYTIRSAGWNSQLLPGGKVVFGFGGKPGNLTEPPRNVQVTGVFAKRVPPVAPYSVTAQLRQTAAWNGGFSALLTLTNGGSTSLTEWQLSIDSRQPLTSILALTWSRRDDTYLISNPGAVLLPGGSATVPIQGSGTLAEETVTNCAVNGSPCAITTILLGRGVPAPTAEDAIVIESLDIEKDALQTTVLHGDTTLATKLRSGKAGSFTATVSNPSVASARFEEDKLIVTGLAAGRTSVRIREAESGAVRFLGIRVRNRDGSFPGMPQYLALGSVSEDTPEHLQFWESFEPGPTNKRVDVRYIYLNGGPFNGWDTWSVSPGGRATNYIRHARRLGIIPFFVFYNIPDGGESYDTDLAHVQSASYMQAYFKNLKLALDVINQESRDDLVGMILEPDFLGYMAQNAKAVAADIPAMTSAAYGSGVLERGKDPDFADNIQGLVRAINYTITKYSPQVYFGWQLNLWASPAGGWTTSIPLKGLIRKTDTLGVPVGRPAIYQEAAAITRYYLDAGIASYGAKFLSIDKYGLDATGFEAMAAADPASSTWFWNNDHWLNYLAFVRAMHDTARLPVVLWQLPVGHINGSTKANPYRTSGVFPDFVDTHQSYQDSSATFFFGDNFQATGARKAYFSKNESSDPTLLVDRDLITWGAHLADAAAAGVSLALFGAGVGQSTTNVGSPPTDAYWWITSAQTYYQKPIPLLGR